MKIVVATSNIRSISAKITLSAGDLERNNPAAPVRQLRDLFMRKALVELDNTGGRWREYPVVTRSDDVMTDNVTFEMKASILVDTTKAEEELKA